MDYQQMYQNKLTTAASAANVIQSGDWVDYGWCVNTPVAVDKEVAKRLPSLENVNFRGGILMWVPEIFQIEDPAAHMTWNSWHMGGIERKAVARSSRYLRWTNMAISVLVRVLLIWLPAANAPK